MSLQKKGIPPIVNGDLVVGYKSARQVKNDGWADLASLNSWYQEDPTKNHLGLINIYETMGVRPAPMYKNFFERRAVLETNGVTDGFTYDLAVSNSKKGVYTTEDTSDYSDAPGIDGGLFPIKLDQAFRNGDILTYDAYEGAQAIVSEDKPIVKEGDSWVHWCTIVDNDSSAWFPPDKLKAGIEYVKIGHSLGEYSTQFSGLTGFTGSDTIKCEFILGNHRGVETYYTMYADKKSFSGATASTRDYINKWMSEAQKIGTDENGNPLDMFYVAKLQNGGVNMRTMRIGSVLERLAIAELMKLEAYQLLFQKGALINDINGTKRLNEGILKQLDRGRVIYYSKPGVVPLNVLKQASAYLYRYRSDIPIRERVLKLKCGRMMHDALSALIQREAVTQLNGMASFNGLERVLPKSPVSGRSLTELEVSPIEFTSVVLPGVGKLEIEHEPTLDFQPLTDRGSKGFYGEEGLPKSSYSAVVYDATNATSYANVNDVVKGASLVVRGDKDANFYYVKPEGEGFYTGYSEGRWSPNKARDIMSSMKTMAREFWCHSISAGWVKDISRYMKIKLQD